MVPELPMRGHMGSAPAAQPHSARSAARLEMQADDLSSDPVPARPPSARRRASSSSQQPPPSVSAGVLADNRESGSHGGAPPSSTEARVAVRKLPPPLFVRGQPPSRPSDVPETLVRKIGYEIGREITSHLEQQWQTQRGMASPPLLARAPAAASSCSSSHGPGLHRNADDVVPCSPHHGITGTAAGAAAGARGAAVCAASDDAVLARRLPVAETRLAAFQKLEAAASPATAACSVDVVVVGDTVPLLGGRATRSSGDVVGHVRDRVRQMEDMGHAEDMGLVRDRVRMMESGLIPVCPATLKKWTLHQINLRARYAQQCIAGSQSTGPDMSARCMAYLCALLAGLACALLSHLAHFGSVTSAVFILQSMVAAAAAMWPPPPKPLPSLWMRQAAAWAERARQRLVRGERLYWREQAAATQIQALARGSLATRDYKKLKASAVRVQASFQSARRVRRRPSATPLSPLDHLLVIASWPISQLRHASECVAGTALQLSEWVFRHLLALSVLAMFVNSLGWMMAVGIQLTMATQAAHEVTELVLEPPEEWAAYLILMVAAVVPMVDTVDAAWQVGYEQLLARVPAGAQKAISRTSSAVSDLWSRASAPLGPYVRVPLEALAQEVSQAIKDLVTQAMQQKAAVLNARAEVKNDLVFSAVETSIGAGGSFVSLDGLASLVRRTGLVRYGSVVIAPPFREYGEMVRCSPVKSLAAILAFVLLVDKYEVQVRSWFPAPADDGGSPPAVGLWASVLVETSSSSLPSCVTGVDNSFCPLLGPADVEMVCGRPLPQQAWFPAASERAPSAASVVVGFGPQPLLASELVIHQTLNSSYVRRVGVRDVSTNQMKISYLADEEIVVGDGKLQTTVLIMGSRYVRDRTGCVGTLSFNKPVLTREVTIDFWDHAPPTGGLSALMLRGTLPATAQAMQEQEALDAARGGTSDNGDVGHSCHRRTHAPVHAPMASCPHGTILIASPPPEHRLCGPRRSAPSCRSRAGAGNGCAPGHEGAH